MILNFRCTDTQALFETGGSRRWSNVLTVATRKLAMPMRLLSYETCALHRETDWKHCTAIELVNIASGSTINGGSALYGPIPALPK